MLVWQRDNSLTTSSSTEKSARNIAELADQQLDDNVQSVRSISQLKLSKNKIENIDEVLARVKARLLPNLYHDDVIITLPKPLSAKARLINNVVKQIPAKARVVNSINFPGLKLNEGVLGSFRPRGSKIV